VLRSRAGCSNRHTGAKSIEYSLPGDGERGAEVTNLADLQFLFRPPRRVSLLTSCRATRREPRADGESLHGGKCVEITGGLNHGLSVSVRDGLQTDPSSRRHRGP